MNENEDLLTPAQAAKMMGVSDQTIRRWVESGKLKASDRNPFLDKARYLIPKKEVEAFMKSRKK